MSTEPENTLTRRRLLRNGAAGSVLLAAGPLLTTAHARSRRGSPQEGRHAHVRPQRRPDAARSGELDHRRRRLHARQDLRAAVRHEPGAASSSRGSRRATRTSTDGLTWTFNLRPGVKFSDGTPLTPADVVFSINRAAANKNGPLSFLDFAIKTIKAKGTQQGRRSRSARRGRRSSRTSRCSRTRSCRRTSAASPRRRSSRSRSAPARSCSTRFTPEQQHSR